MESRLTARQPLRQSLLFPINFKETASDIRAKCTEPGHFFYHYARTRARGDVTSCFLNCAGSPDQDSALPVAAIGRMPPAKRSLGILFGGVATNNAVGNCYCPAVGDAAPGTTYTACVAELERTVLLPRLKVPSFRIPPPSLWAAERPFVMVKPSITTV